MKIICISQVYWPDTASVAQHLVDLLQALSGQGHEITIITSRHNYEHPEIIYRLVSAVSGFIFTVCRTLDSASKRNLGGWLIFLVSIF